MFLYTCIQIYKEGGAGFQKVISRTDPSAVNDDGSMMDQLRKIGFKLK